MHGALMPNRERMLYTVDTNNNTNNNKQKLNDQNIYEQTEADLLVDRRICEKNNISAGDFVVVQFDVHKKIITVDK